MVLLALGPLRLSHESLWTLTWGELEDLIHAWSYAEYLETRKRAQLAAWILNGSGHLKTPVRVNDLAGRWIDGRVMTEKQYREHLKRKIQEKKRRRGGDT